MDIECCTKNVALKTENETQNREQLRHVFSDKFSSVSEAYRNTRRCANVLHLIAVVR